MMKRVYIAGLKGNMGRRYGLICKYLGINCSGNNNDISFSEQVAHINSVNSYEGIIIATPTQTHADALKIFLHELDRDIPILIEKPISTGLVELAEKSNVRMVNQYEYLIDKDASGITYYNYFKTGDDGLFWDCINIIGLAKEKVEIKNDSLMWECIINGQPLNIADMDWAYIQMIRDWAENPTPNVEYIKKAHFKVMNEKMFNSMK